MKQRALFIAVVTLLGCSETGKADAAGPMKARGGATSVAAADEAWKPSDIAAKMQKSYDSEATGNLEEALTQLEGIGHTDHVGYVADLRRGWLFYRLGKNVESIAAYEKAKAMASSAIEAKLGLLGPLAALRRWIDVEREAREILEKDPANYTATIRLAYALYSQAKFADAAATYRVLANSYPSDVEVAGGLGWALLKAGKTDAAADVFRQVLDVAPKNALSLDGLRASSKLAHR